MTHRDGPGGPRVRSPERITYRNGRQTAPADPQAVAREGVGRVPLLLFAISVSSGVVLSAHIARGGSLLAVRWRLLAELLAWVVAWVVAVAATLRVPRRTALGLIFVAAVALRVAAISGPPTTTDDFYRYTWDGRVQTAGISPYEYTPSSPELAHLREPWLWPEERPCPLAYRPDACTRINRPSVPTIYPPLAEAWFAGIYRLTGVEARWKPWQVAGLVTDVAVVALLAAALRRRSRDPRWVALYALCPAPVLEIVNNGHVDGFALLLAVAALMAAHERRDVTAGALIGAAALVKLFPLLLVLPVVAATTGRRGGSLLRVGGAAVAVVMVGYLPHFLRVGAEVAGFLPGYLREEHYDGAGRYLVAGALRVPGGMAGFVSVAAMAAAAVWVWQRRPAAPAGAAVLMGTLLLATSPVQPWYAVTLLAFAALAAEPIWAAVVVAGYPHFMAVILLHPQRVGIGQLAYGLAALTVAAAFLLRGPPASGRSMRGCPPNGC